MNYTQLTEARHGQRSGSDVPLCQQHYVVSAIFTLKLNGMPGYEISDQR